MERRDVVVVGGGITGLSAAFSLSRAGLDTLLVERSDRLGGVIRTHREDGWCFELGPNTVLEKEPVSDLLREAGLHDDVVSAKPAAERRYVWKDDRLIPLPSGPLGFLTTPLFPLGAKLRLLREPWIPPADEGIEESIGDFVRRRLGQAFLDYAVGPFVSGVYAGDPDRLSVRWAVSRIHALEEEHGSLIRGALARSKGPAPAGRMISYRGGLERLPRLLGQRIGEVRSGTPVREIEPSGSGFLLEAGEATVEAGAVVLAVPAEVTAELLGTLTGGESRILEEIPYAPIAIVGLGFPSRDVEHPLEGFGFLAPRRESLRILGCLFTSSLFPDRAPEERVALTAFAGGRTDPDLVDLGEDELVDLVRGDLERALGIRGDPSHRVVARWPRAIPQYEVGHGRFVRWVERLEADTPGLVVAGSFVGGVSVPDSIRRGREAARRVLGLRSGGEDR